MNVLNVKSFRRIKACTFRTAFGSEETSVVRNIEKIGIEAGYRSVRFPRTGLSHDEHSPLGTPHRRGMDGEIACFAC